VFACVFWYLCYGLHSTFLTARTECDVDSCELEHDILKGVCDFEQLRGQLKQTPDKGQIGIAITISQKAIVSDSDKALG